MLFPAVQEISDTYAQSVILMPNQAWIHWGTGGCAHHPPKRIHCNSFRHLRGSTTHTKSGLCSLSCVVPHPPPYSGCIHAKAK